MYDDIKVFVLAKNWYYKLGYFLILESSCYVSLVWKIINRSVCVIVWKVIHLQKVFRVSEWFINRDWLENIFLKAYSAKKLTSLSLKIVKHFRKGGKYVEKLWYHIPFIVIKVETTSKGKDAFNWKVFPLGDLSKFLTKKKLLARK